MSELTAVRQSWEGKLEAAPSWDDTRAVVAEITRDLGADAETEAWIGVTLAKRFGDSGVWLRTWFTKERTRLAVEARAAEITKGLEAQPPAWKAELVHIQDWEEWKPAAVELVKA